MRATLDGWRAEVIAEVEAEIANDDSATNDCAIVRVPVNTAPPTMALTSSAAHLCMVSPTLSIMPETRRDSSRLKRLKEDSIEKSSLPAPPAF